ncbi:hypothetical protein EI94DRAFT_1700764 [Lactarius quietus]|nr:hypothetical protein EI94DRAFT_1700764 [Lactarius quietus]
MGEIETMQPLSVINEDDFEYNMHISTTSVVVEEDRANATFVLHILQFTMGSPASNKMVIRGFLMQSPKWPNPTEHLPVLKSIINIGGTLQWFKTYSPSPSHATTCAVVNVGKMCYLWKPPAKAATNAASASFQPKGKMRAKMHAHAQHIAETDPCNSPSTSQTVLGKQKSIHPKTKLTIEFNWRLHFRLLRQGPSGPIAIAS